MRRRNRQATEADFAAVVRARLARLRVPTAPPPGGWVPRRPPGAAAPVLPDLGVASPMRDDGEARAGPVTGNLGPAGRWDEPPMVPGEPLGQLRAVTHPDAALRGPAHKARSAGRVGQDPPLSGRSRPRVVLGRLFQGQWELGRFHVPVVIGALVVGLGGAGLVYASSRPDPQPVSAVTDATGTPMAGVGGQDDSGTPNASAPDDSGGATAGRGEPKEFVVHVAGMVKQPGIVSLPSGSRVVDAVEAAGGATKDADLSLLNLARPLGDGEQIVVGDDAPPPTGQPAAEEQAVININSASIEELETLPGVGPELGRRIVEWRESYGGFTSVEELLEVSGIGDKTLAELEPLVTV